MADETPAQRSAEEKLDEVTREVAWDELDKSQVTTRAGIPGVAVPWATRWRRWFVPLFRWRDPDPTDERGLREVLHEGRDKE